jgi:hypothetical protein
MGAFVYAHEARESRHMVGVSKARGLELWQLLAQGRTQELEALPWQPGAISPEEAARR